MQQFKDKETRLLLALNKVKARLEYLKANQNILPQSVLQYWNNWHDLQDRLEHRLWVNWSQFKDWHFDTHGFNTYL